MTRAPWYAVPEVLDLLASIASDPPRRVWSLAPLRSVFEGGSELILTYDDRDARIAELRRLSNTAFLAAEAEGGREGALAHLALPSVGKLITIVIEATAHHPTEIAA